jgi:hypothetical protein
MEVAELALDIKDFPLHENLLYLERFSSLGIGYNLMQKALQAYLFMLKTNRKKWSVNPVLDLDNFTLAALQNKKICTTRLIN